MNPDPCDNTREYQRLRQMLFPGFQEPPAEASSAGHHLTFERHKGWTLRVTVQIGKKIVGKRLKFYLKTRILSEAEKNRELVLSTLRKLGLTVKLRHQKKKGAPADV